MNPRQTSFQDKTKPQMIKAPPLNQQKNEGLYPRSHYFAAFSSFEIILIAFPVPIATDSNGFGAI